MLTEAPQRPAEPKPKPAGKKVAARKAGKVKKAKAAKKAKPTVAKKTRREAGKAKKRVR
jgi:hypothetical protein